MLEGGALETGRPPAYLYGGEAVNGKIVLGWRAMMIIDCPDCGWALEGAYSGRHVAGRIAPRAVCLGYARWPWEEDIPKGLPPEHRLQWREKVPPALVSRRDDGIPDPFPDPHSPAWDYLPPAPLQGCTCGYYLAFDLDAARAVLIQHCAVIILYCQALGHTVLYTGGVRTETFRVLGFSAEWCDRVIKCSYLSPGGRAWARKTYAPLITRPHEMPTGVFDKVPPEAAALM